MARIPDEALERLKREVSLACLIEAQGLKLISQGKDLACRCPWHKGILRAARQQVPIDGS
jgi:DNA primase